MPHATGPLDIFTDAQLQLMYIHAALKAGCQSIIDHLETPPLHDLRNFFGYCEAWAMTVQHHLEVEDNIIFPFLSQEFDMSAETDELETIQSSLTVIIQIIHSARAYRPCFNPTQLRKSVASVQEILCQHLDDELARFDKENVALFEEAEVGAMMIDAEKYAQSLGDATIRVPFLRSHTSAVFKVARPSTTPWLVRKTRSLRHLGYWKYSPYSV